MLNLRASISIMALLIGIGIFFVSLIATTEISFGRDIAMSQRKLYFGTEILPDNVLYPLVSGADRLRLELADPSETVILQLQYAERRHQSALELVNKGENDLALVTFKKSQGYLASAVENTTAISTATHLNNYLLEMVEQHVADMKIIRSSMTDAEQLTLNNIIADTEILAEKLQTN